ncbi:MAG: phosphoglycerate mutase, partial [Planctomycetota bacterium]
MDFSFYQKLAVEKKGNKIVLLVLDGLGGLPYGEMGQTELEVAQTPELDALARRSSLGLLDPVAPGITPGSGPGHLALFGYDPVEFQVGRGVLAALGIGFSLEPKDVACRINFCTLDEKGVITDRRAGRISTDECRRRVEKLKNIRVDGAELFIEPVMDYRAVLVLRGEGLSGDLEDTDPQITGVPPLPPRGRSEGTEKTVQIIQSFLDQARKALQDEEKGNGILLRGFDTFHPLPSLGEIYKFKAAAIAVYPMYKGAARLVGMEVLETGPEIEDEIQTLAKAFEE